MPSRWKGWKRRSTSSGGITGPVFLTVMVAWPAVAVVAISIRPPAALWRRALSTRFATKLSTRFGSPAARAVASVVSTWMPRCWASWRRARTTFPAISARSKGSRCSIPLFAGCQGEQRLDEAFLLLAERQDVLAGGSQPLGGGVWIGECHLQQGPLGGERGS